jgi:hypothetical protein
MQIAYRGLYIQHIRLQTVKHADCMMRLESAPNGSWDILLDSIQRQLVSAFIQSMISFS